MNIYTQAVPDSLRSAMEGFDREMSPAGERIAENSEHK